MSVIYQEWRGSVLQFMLWWIRWKLKSQLRQWIPPNTKPLGKQEKWYVYFFFFPVCTSELYFSEYWKIFHCLLFSVQEYKMKKMYVFKNHMYEKSHVAMKKHLLFLLGRWKRRQHFGYKQVGKWLLNKLYF